MSAIHVCHHWLAPDRRVVYMFAPNEGAKHEGAKHEGAKGLEDAVRKMRKRGGVDEVRVVEARVNDDDTVEVLRAKFVHHALGGSSKGSKANVYGWYRQSLAAHDVNDLIDEVFDKRAAVRSGELVTSLRIHFPSIRPGIFGEADSLYDRASALKVICEKGFEHRVVPLEFAFVSPDSARPARIPGMPFNTRRMGVDDARRVRVAGRILSALRCDDREYHFVTDKVLDNPVYFDPSPPGLPDFRKIQVADDTLDAIDACVREGVVETKGNIQRLILRVFPREEVRVDFSRVLYGFELSKEVPMISHMSSNSRVYRTRKEVLRTMPPKLVQYVEAFENDRRDRVCKHNVESVIFYCVFEGSVFRIVMSDNGSYRVFYRFARGTAPAYDVVRRSFRIIREIVEYVDRGRGAMFVMSPNANIFDNDKVEVVEQVVVHTVVLSSRLVSTPVFMRNVGDLGSLFGESENGMLKYKRVDRFRDMDAVAYFVHTHVQISREDLVSRVSKEFDMSEEEAESAVEANMRDDAAPGVMKHGGRAFAKMSYNPGVHLMVRAPNDHTLVVRSAQCAHPKYAENALRAVIYAASRRKVRKSGDIESARKKKGAEAETSAVEDELQYGDFVNNTSVDDFLNSDGFDLDMFDIGVDLNVENDADIKEAEGDGDVEGPGSDLGEGEGEGDETMTDSKRYTTFVLNKLIEADRELFTWEDKNFRNYAAKCGAVDFRQPIVINASEKAKIDSDHPESYTGYVQTGSTPELAKRNYYICPKLWCKLGRYSITEEEFEKNGQKCGPPFFEKPLRFPPEGKPNYFKTTTGKEVHVPHFLKKSMHPKNLSMPCCAKRSKDAIMETEEVQDAQEDSRSRYISGIDIDKALHPGRLGQTTEGLASALRGTSYAGPLTKDTECLARVGVDNINGHGLARCAEAILEDKRYPNVYHAVADKMEVWHYVALNGGHTMRTFSHPEDASRASDAKARRELLRFLSTNERYVRMFGLERVVATMESTTDARSMYEDVVREMMIWTSFQRYKAYMLDDDFAKSEDDLYHLLHFDFVNPKRYGFVIVREKDARTTQVVNPKYFELTEATDVCERFAIVVRVQPGVYEYVTKVEGRDGRTALFDHDDVEYMLRRMRRLARTKVAATDTYVVGYDMKWRGTMDTKGAIRPMLPPRALPLMREVAASARFRYEENAPDSSIFTRAPEDDSYTPFGTRIYELARDVLANKTLRDEFNLLRHELNPLSTQDRARLLRDSYVAAETSPSARAAPVVAFERLLSAPLEYFVAEYEHRTHQPSALDLFITHTQVVRGTLSAQYARSKNTYRFWDSTSDDKVEFVDVLLEDPSGDEANVRWVDRYVPLRPARVASMFPNLEMHDSEMDLADIVRLCDGGSFEEFVSAYVAEMRHLVDTDPRAFFRRLGANPNVREHPTIERAWAIDGFEEMIRRDTYHPSIQDVEFVAKHFDQTFLLVSRASSGSDGVVRLGPSPSTTVFVLHHQRDTAPERIAFRLVVDRRRRSAVLLSSISEEKRGALLSAS